jgi:hypothetical protein
MSGLTYSEFYNENANSLRRYLADEIIKSKSLETKHGRIERKKSLNDLLARARDTLLAHYFSRS